MSLSHVFSGVLMPILVGAVVVFALLLALRFGIPRRSAVVVTRRTTD